MKIKGSESKTARAHAATPLWEAGNIILPDDDSTEDFVEEHIKFPKTKHDDEVDASNQALNYFIGKKRQTSIMAGMAKQ